MIKPDHTATYRDYLKKLSDGYKKAGATSFSVYQGVMGNPLEFMIVRQVANHAALDEGSPLDKAYTPAERAAMNTQRDQSTDSAKITYERGVFSFRRRHTSHLSHPLALPSESEHGQHLCGRRENRTGARASQD